MKGKKVTITIEMICIPEEDYETVGGLIRWLKKYIKHFITQDETRYKKIKISSKIDKIKE